jgi:hypothetical protein
MPASVRLLLARELGDHCSWIHRSIYLATLSLIAAPSRWIQGFVILAAREFGPTQNDKKKEEEECGHSRMNEAKLRSKIPHPHWYSYIYERNPCQEDRSRVDWSSLSFRLFFPTSRREERQSKLLGFGARLGRISLMRFVRALTSQTSQSEAIPYWTRSLFLISS